ncbi:magnesium-translocating P-type ATPase [Ramlibacter sp.]|uniref:magnesium-translocating P-type ATPase n=1 Tax=Ramlibacter sp. TaxID=1917967 RepID=UPI002BC8AC62|nr:magnesium-translocating P-type ATPase [Ramlibacter sp.]HWI81179.1 magnesium-translocating P-type ATPase [Ramlibacter sp.]
MARSSPPAAAAPAGADAWWRQPPEAAVAALAGSAQGLTEDEARARLQRHGPNRLAPPPRWRLFDQLARRLRDPLVLVLLVAGAVSLATGEPASAGIIAVVVLLSVALDQIQQGQAESAARRLRESVAVRARVLRDGREQDIDVAALVPGDVVRLAAGCLVPADGLLLAAQDLFVRESTLTGESFPAEKRVAGAGQDGALFMGSSVLSGAATMVVCRTGAATQIGGMSGVLAGGREDLAFEHDLRQFGHFILRITLFLVLLVLFVSSLAHRSWVESFLFAVALAVGLTPELLPMVVTISLSRGALRLAREQVIVKRLSAIHNLGAVDVLCTDKTGTLTEAKIELVRHVDIAGRDSGPVVEAAFLNSFFESGIHTPLEEAILAHGQVDPAGWRKIDEIPFDFERRRLSVLADRDGDRRLIVKGAPHDVLVHCDRFQDGAVAPAWTAEARALADATLQRLEAEGFRVLGIASKAVPASLVDAGLDDENELVFLGYAAFLDPPKADAHAAIADLLTKGVEVKVLTGDSELVTQHVCRALGLRIKGVVLGTEIDRLDVRALARRASRANLFCRVNPIQKNRIIQALRARGHVVGYVGDGVNDAPALHSADVGISVDSAADTARAAADLIMLNHSLAVLDAAVTEGRRTCVNTRKYLLLGTSSNFGNMASMAAAALFLPFLPMLPVQILLNNLLYDGVSAALPLDRVEPAEALVPQRWDMGQLRRFMFTFGPLSSLFDFATFGLLLYGLGATTAQFRSGWFIESLATQVLAVFVIRTRGAALAGRPHPALAAAAAAVLLFAALLPWTPLAPLFGLVALPAPFYAALAAMTLGYLAVLELVKRRFWPGASNPWRARRASKTPEQATPG